jgi:hypothetical protein
MPEAPWKRSRPFGAISDSDDCNIKPGELTLLAEPQAAGDEAIRPEAIRTGSWRSLKPNPVPDVRSFARSRHDRRLSPAMSSFYFWPTVVVVAGAGCFAVWQMTSTSGKGVIAATGRPADAVVTRASPSGLTPAVGQPDVTRSIEQPGPVRGVDEPAAARPAVDVRAATADEPRSAEPSAAGPNDTAAPDAARPERATSAMAPDRQALLLKRGFEFLKDGNVAAARLMLQSAADAGNAQAALLLGATYDPLMLADLGVRGLQPDREVARTWYRRAQEYGSSEAAGRIERLAQMGQ